MARGARQTLAALGGAAWCVVLSGGADKIALLAFALSNAVLELTCATLDAARPISIAALACATRDTTTTACSGFDETERAAHTRTAVSTAATLLHVTSEAVQIALLACCSARLILELARGAVAADGLAAAAVVTTGSALRAPVHARLRLEMTCDAGDAVACAATPAPCVLLPFGAMLLAHLACG